MLILFKTCYTFMLYFWGNMNINFKIHESIFYRCHGQGQNRLALCNVLFVNQEIYSTSFYRKRHSKVT